MKLLVQSDDYGFTKGVVDGCIDAVKNGYLGNTGLFANMPCAEYAVERIKAYPQICFGIDINVASGPCVSEPSLLPTLVNQKTGCFITTKERLKDPEYANKTGRPYYEVMIEGRAQIEKFIRLTGKKPEYIAPHSTQGEKEYERALSDLGREYGIVFRKEVLEKYHFKVVQTCAAAEYFKEKGITRDSFRSDKEIHQKANIFSLECQTLPEEDATIRALQKELDAGSEFVYLGTHCAYVDADLFAYTRQNIDRAFDHQLLTSAKVMNWLKENKIELISYRDLK